VLTVPESALVVAASGSALFVLEPRGELYAARRAAVVTGERSDGRVEIRSGLRDGERVAVAGVSLLTDGAPAIEAPAADGTVGNR
jgi:multidrug efflux system membrane fusion protein